jgi:aminopeptidase N
VEKPKGVQIEQSRYFSSAISKKRQQNKTIWQIPLSYKASASGKLNKILMKEKTLDLQAKPFKINIGESGFYRVDYPAKQNNLADPA